MKTKIKVGVIFGGRSAEHEVSLKSAKNIIEAIDKSKYDVVLISIDKKGKWHLNENSHYLLNSNDLKEITLPHMDNDLGLIPGATSHQLMSVSKLQRLENIDVIFPVLHGPYGEDGTIQGLMKLINLPFVGAGVLGSAVGMDKDVMKRLLRDAGIPIADFIVLHKHDISKVTYSLIEDRLGMPVFIKPSNLGSSIGVCKVTYIDDFYEAVENAFKYDNKIVIEAYIDGREIECAVLGNENPIASIPGEIIPTHEFYSYDAKYLDENGAALKIPANLPEELIMIIQDLAIRTFKVLCCEGMARVDFFLQRDNQIVVNEINTIPGFTQISMYPKLWEASGVPCTDLVDRLIQLAIDRLNIDQDIKTTSVFN